MHYLSNAALAQEILACQRDNYTISATLTDMLMLLVQRCATRVNWRHYSYLDDMRGEAIYQLVRTSRNDARPNVLKFSFEYSQRAGKTPNPFSYATTVINNVFRRYVRTEQIQARLRDDLLIAAHMQPSARRQWEEDMARSAEPIPPRKSVGRPKRT